MASYGDSETESDDEDVDFENLDSVSIVAARASSSSSSTSSTSSNGSLPHGPLIHRGEPRVRAHGASPSLDSGRGDSPESSCNSTLVLTPNTTQSKYIICRHLVKILNDCLCEKSLKYQQAVVQTDLVGLKKNK